MIPIMTNVICFSPTGTSKKSALSIAQAFTDSPNVIDVTTFGSVSEKTAFADNELVIFGAPCYGGRIPKVAAERLDAFRGNNTPCIVTVTYGNRDYDDALLEMMDMAVKNGFIPVGAAALIGQHTFGTIQVGRPNDDDAAEDKEFGKKVLEKLAKINDLTGAAAPEFKGNRPYKDGGNGGKFRPVTTDDCIKCGYCVRMCPMGAIDKADPSVIDNDKCISCFRCIKVCPKKAKTMTDEGYLKFAVDFSAKLAARRENEYYL